MIFKDKLLVGKPIISVCVPTFNQEKYISETLDSILSQLIDIPFEIIIADDCSSDDTTKICLDYQNRFPERIIFISNEQNQGLLINLFDVLFSNVRGKYIAVCAGDDVWINTKKLAKQFEIIDNNNNISVVHTGYNKFHEVTNQLTPMNCWDSPLMNFSGKEALKDVIFENFSSYPLASSMMFRKETINKYRCEYDNLIYDKDALGEGLILQSFFTLDGVFAFIPEIMVNYRIREESLCHFIDNEKQLIFNIQYRILQKTLIAKTFVADNNLIKRINRSFLSLYLEAINNKCEETFFNQYNYYKKENAHNIPSYVKFLISFFSISSFNKFIFKKVLSTLLQLKNSWKKRKD